MKRYKRKFKEKSFPGADSYMQDISNAIVGMYNDALEYNDNDEYQTLDRVAEDTAEAIDDCVYDMIGPDRKKHSAFKAYLKKYIGN